MVCGGSPSRLGTVVVLGAVALGVFVSGGAAAGPITKLVDAETR